MFFLDFFRHLQDKHGQKVSFLILLSFLFAFVVARTYALITAPILNIKGIHIHHLNFGISLLAISGLLGFYYGDRAPRCIPSGANIRKKGVGGAETARKIPTLISRCDQRDWVHFSDSKWRKKIIVLYGIGLGLTFDEFGMWLHLEDQYWMRTSYDAIVIISLVLLNAIFFGERWMRIFKLLSHHTRKTGDQYKRE